MAAWQDRHTLARIIHPRTTTRQRAGRAGRARLRIRAPPNRSPSRFCHKGGAARPMARALGPAWPLDTSGSVGHAGAMTVGWSCATSRALSRFLGRRGPMAPTSLNGRDGPRQERTARLADGNGPKAVERETGVRRAGATLPGPELASRPARSIRLGGRGLSRRGADLEGGPSTFPPEGRSALYAVGTAVVAAVAGARQDRADPHQGRLWRQRGSVGEGVGRARQVSHREQRRIRRGRRLLSRRNLPSTEAPRCRPRRISARDEDARLPEAVSAGRRLSRVDWGRQDQGRAGITAGRGGQTEGRSERGGKGLRRSQEVATGQAIRQGDRGVPIRGHQVARARVGRTGAVPDCGMPFSRRRPGGGRPVS